MAIINSEIRTNKSPEYCNIQELSKYKFNIPQYQRAYSWKKDNIEELFESIIEVINSDDCENLNYIGNILISKNREKYDVIDGQQRITTIFLMIKAIIEIYDDLMNSVNAVHMSSNDKADCKEDFNYKELNKILYYSNMSSTNVLQRDREKKLRIDHSDKNEKSKFENAMHKKGNENSNTYKKNFILIKKIINDYIDKTSIITSVNSLLLIKNIVIENTVLLVIDVPEVDTAFSIFESLNTKGLQLTAFDLVNGNIENNRKKINVDIFDNYKQSRDTLVDSSWDEDDILVYYLQAKVNPKLSKNKIYGEIKKLLDADINKTVNEISYVFETINNIESNLYNEYNLMVILKRKQIYPIILGLSLKANNQEFSESMIEIINFTIIFSIIDLNVKLNSPGGEFKNIILDIIGYIREHEIDNITLDKIKEINSIKVYLDNLQIDKAEVSSVEDSVKKALLLYLMINENTSVILKYNELHLEHVLPQKPEKWAQSQPTEWKGNLDNYIHSIGNMTILDQKLNKRQSNLPLSEKKEIMFNEKSNEFLKNSEYNKIDYDNFNKEYIKNREAKINEKLINTILNIK